MNANTSSAREKCPWALQDFLALGQIIVFGALLVLVGHDCVKKVAAAREAGARAQEWTAKQELCARLCEAANAARTAAQKACADNLRRIQDKQADARTMGSDFEQRYNMSAENARAMSENPTLWQQIVSKFSDLKSDLRKIDDTIREVERLNHKKESLRHDMEDKLREFLRCEGDLKHARELAEQARRPVYSIGMFALHLMTGFYAGIMLARSALRFCQFRGLLVGTQLSKWGAR